jgi:type IV pilus assembly protein PilQ
MSNQKRASFVGRLSIISLSLSLSFLVSASALAQTQVATSGATKTTSGSDRKNGHGTIARTVPTATPAARPTVTPAPGTASRSEEKKSDPLRSASTVRNISVRQEGSDFIAAIDLDGQAAFNHFTLSSPNRIVIDVKKASNLATPLLSLGQNGVERVRTGNFQGNVRIVFDTSSPQRYFISREGAQIIVRFPGKHEGATRTPDKSIIASAAATKPAPGKTESVKAETAKTEPARSSASARAATNTSADSSSLAVSKPVATPSPKASAAKPEIAKSESKLNAAKSETKPVTAPTPTVVKESDKSRTAKSETAARTAEKPVALAAATPQPTDKESKVLPFEAKPRKAQSEVKPPRETEKKSASVSVTASPVALTKQPGVKAQPKTEIAVVAEPKAQPKPVVTAPAQTKTSVIQNPSASVAAPASQKSEAALPVPREVRPRVIAPVSNAQPKLIPTPQPKLTPTPVPAPAPVVKPEQKPVSVPAPVSAPKPQVTDKPLPIFNAADYKKESFTGEPIKLDLKSVDIREVLRFISDTYRVNFVIDKSVGEAIPVTVSVEEVPWNQALEALLKSNRLGVQVEGNILRVMAQTAIAEEDTVRSKQAEARVQAAPLVTEVIALNYARAFFGNAGGLGGGGDVGAGAAAGGAAGARGGLEAIIRSRLSPRGTVEPDSRTNTLVITDVAENLAVIKDMIRKLDVPEPQVEIEARIVIANRNFARDLGVQLGGTVVDPGRGGVYSAGTLPNQPTNGLPPVSGTGGTGGTGGSLFGGLADTLRAAGATFGLGLTTGRIGTGQISALLTAAESKGNIKTISTPRITAQNNQRANIVNGVQIPVQTESNNTVTVSFVTAALKLEITPQINSLGTVMLHVIAENNSVNLAIATRSAPGINTQRAETQVLVPDGGTTIIGGINIDTESQAQQRTPGVSRIPGLGELFKRRTVSRQNDEILFFITPRIYKALEMPAQK